MLKPFDINVFKVGHKVTYYSRCAYHDINNWNEGYTTHQYTGVITHISPNDIQIECEGLYSKPYLTSANIDSGFYKIELNKE